MANGLEWEKEIKRLPRSKKIKYLKALQDLLTWEMFKREYGWTGVETIKNMLKWESSKI